MKEDTLVAVFDRAGSECAKRYHFVVGKKDDVMAGGIYISKDIDVPDLLTITFKKGDDYVVAATIEAEKRVSGDRKLEIANAVGRASERVIHSGKDSDVSTDSDDGSGTYS
jgi:hypothetical protein